MVAAAAPLSCWPLLLLLPGPPGAAAPAPIQLERANSADGKIVCLWNTSALPGSGLPGCCGWPDGCSCGCCQHNYTAQIAGPARSEMSVVSSAGTRPSTTRFLSFYDECGVDLLPHTSSSSSSSSDSSSELLSRAPLSGTTALANPACSRALQGCWPVKADQTKCRACESRQQGVLHTAGCTEDDIAHYCTPESSRGSGDFESLPLAFGVCTPLLPLWGCWRDQLQILSGQHGSGVMMHIRGSGPLICAAAPGAFHLCNNNCSDLFATDHLLGPAWKNASGAQPAVCGLAWLEGWLQELKPAVATGAVRGFFVGDELVINGLGLSELEAVAAKVHAVMDSVASVFVYTNEGCHDNGPIGWPSIPASLDVISIDGYHAGRNESDSMRAIYEKHLFPKLQPHQRVAVVPGLVGCACGTDIADGFCEGQVCTPSPTSPTGVKCTYELPCTYNDSLTHQCNCAMSGEDITLEGQQALLLEKIEAYMQWAKEDPRVAGIVPW